MLATIYMVNGPLDFVSTDGMTYNLYRLHGLELHKYENLSAEEVGKTRSICIFVLSSLSRCMGSPYLIVLRCFILANDTPALHCHKCASMSQNRGLGKGEAGHGPALQHMPA